mgnify:CR=1 FL=1|jgi:hypothetical protein
MNEADFFLSISEILTKRLTPEKATSEEVRNLFNHPQRDDLEIQRVTRLAVFSKLAGVKPKLERVHLVNRLFAYWTILSGLRRGEEPWASIKESAWNGAEALLFDLPEYVAKAREEIA